MSGALALALVALAAPLHAQAPRPVDAVLQDLVSVQLYPAVTISPAGTHVAWVERREDRSGFARSAIYVAELGAGGSSLPRRITAGKGGPLRERAPVFSPDGKRIAFLSDAAADRQLQLYVADIDGGRLERITSLSGSLSEPSWAPDGKSLALLVLEGRQPGPAGPALRDEGEVGEPEEAQRIAIADIAHRSARLVSPAGLHVYEYDWSRDARTFAAVTTRGPADESWWTAELTSIDALTGDVATLARPKTQICEPRWSPDGESVAFIGGLMSDQGANGGDVFVVPAKGGEPRNLTPGMKSTATSLTWLEDGRIVFGEIVSGECGVSAIPAGAARAAGTPPAPARLWQGAEVISCGQGISIALSRDGQTSAVVRQAFDRPPEVYAGAVGAWKPVTKKNASAPMPWGRAKALRVRAADGVESGAWLLSPPENVASRRSLVVLVHGGPSAAHLPGWPLRWSGLLASQGHTVLLPNPRGSFGEGEAFTRANVKDFGHGDFQDILAAVDAAVASEKLDPSRVGIAGWSYGGFMAMWAVTQTNRFAAAVAGAGIANWQSYYGTNRIGQWMLPFFGASVYDDPAVYAKSSPILHVKNAKTPTLILHGERDAEVPASQGYELWRALKTFDVPTKLVIYPDEGHRISRPENALDVARRIAGWFERYLQGEPARPASALTKP